MGSYIICDCLQIAPTEEEVTAMRAYDGTLQGLAPPEKVMWVSLCTR
jgi:hypothetical protein